MKLSELTGINEKTDIKVIINIVIHLLKYLSVKLNITPAQRFRFESAINILQSKQK